MSEHAAQDRKCEDPRGWQLYLFGVIPISPRMNGPRDPSLVRPWLRYFVTLKETIRG